MPQTILVPIGDPAQTEHAIQQAASLAQMYPAGIVLLGLGQNIEHGATYQFTDPVIWNARKNQMQVALAERAAELEGQGIAVETVMLDIAKPEIFIRYVTSGVFEMMVVADADPLPRAMVRDVLAHSSVPIYIARPQRSGTFRRVMLPLDGSQRAECVVPLATRLTQIMSATLLLAHVVKEPEMPRRPSPNAEDMRLVEQVVARNREESERYLNELSARLPVTSEVHILTKNNVDTALHDLVREQSVDLVALCAHGFSGEPEHPLGGTASNLIDHSMTSLLVLQDLPAAPPSIEETQIHRPLGGR